MKAYAQLTMFMMVILMITASDSLAQGRRQGKTGGRRQGGGLTIQRDGNSTNRRQDVEGTIWEFKVMDNNESNKSKRTKMTGRIRIKQSSVFAVASTSVAGARRALRGRSSCRRSSRPTLFDFCPGIWLRYKCVSIKTASLTRFLGASSVFSARGRHEH